MNPVKLIPLGLEEKTVEIVGSPNEIMDALLELSRRIDHTIAVRDGDDTWFAWIALWNDSPAYSKSAIGIMRNRMKMSQ